MKSYSAYLYSAYLDNDAQWDLISIEVVHSDNANYIKNIN